MGASRSLWGTLLGALGVSWGPWGLLGRQDGPKRLARARQIRKREFSKKWFSHRTVCSFWFYERATVLSDCGYVSTNDCIERLYAAAAAATSYSLMGHLVPSRIVSSTHVSELLDRCIDRQFYGQTNTLLLDELTGQTHCGRLMRRPQIPPHCWMD